MTAKAAETLAALVRQSVAGAVAVQRDGRFFVVVVDSALGRHILYDEVDWQSLQGRIAPS